MSTYTLWLIFASLSVVGSLMYNIAVKVGGNNHINAFVFTFALAVAATIGHGIILALYKFVFQPDAKLNIDPTGMGMVMLAGAGVIMIDLAYFFAVKYGGVAPSQAFWTIGGIIILAPVAVLLFKEHLNWYNVLGIALGIVALFLIAKK